jgi:hypothetical protein
VTSLRSVADYHLTARTRTRRYGASRLSLRAGARGASVYESDREVCVQGGADSDRLARRRRLAKAQRRSSSAVGVLAVVVVVLGTVVAWLTLSRRDTPHGVTESAPPVIAPPPVQSAPPPPVSASPTPAPPPERKAEQPPTRPPAPPPESESARAAREVKDALRRCDELARSAAAAGLADSVRNAARAQRILGAEIDRAKLVEFTRDLVKVAVFERRLPADIDANMMASAIVDYAVADLPPPAPALEPTPAEPVSTRPAVDPVDAPPAPPPTTAPAHAQKPDDLRILEDAVAQIRSLDITTVDRMARYRALTAKARVAVCNGQIVDVVPAVKARRVKVWVPNWVKVYANGYSVWEDHGHVEEQDQQFATVAVIVAADNLPTLARRPDSAVMVGDRGESSRAFLIDDRDAKKVASWRKGDALQWGETLVVNEDTGQITSRAVFAKLADLKRTPAK